MPFGSADPVARRVDGQAVERDAVGRERRRRRPGHPAFSAGEPGIGRVTTAGSRARAACSPSCHRRPRRADLGADALELAVDALEALDVVVRAEVAEYGSPSDSIMPRIAPCDDASLVDVAAGVAVADRVVGVPERLEGRRRRAAACPGRPALARPRRVAGDEQRRAGQDDDEGDGDRRAPATLRPAARCDGRGAPARRDARSIRRRPGRRRLVRPGRPGIGRISGISGVDGAGSGSAVTIARILVRRPGGNSKCTSSRPRSADGPIDEWCREAPRAVTGATARSDGGDGFSG